MRKIFGISAMAILALAATFLFGCGGDSPTKAEGDTDDPEFRLMDVIFSGAMRGADAYSLELSMGLSDSVVRMGAIGKPRFNTRKAGQSELDIFDLNYTYSNFWHTYAFEARYVSDDEADTISFYGIDSLRFISEGDPVQYPDELTNLMQSRMHLNYEARDNGEIYLDIVHHTHFDVLIGVSDVISYEVDGNATDTMLGYFNIGNTVICDIAINGSMDYNNIGYSIGSGCPVTGSAAASVSVAIDCESESESLVLDGTWTADWVFDDGVVSAGVEFGNTRWEYTDQCGNL